MGTGLEIALVAAAVATTASTVYSAVQAEDAEDKQQEALNKQAEQTKQASEMEAENQRKAARAALSTQRARLAQAGVTLEEAGTSGQLSKDIQSDLARNINTLGVQKDWQLQNIESQRSLLPSPSSTAISAGLNVAGTLAGSYAGYQTAQTNQALLARSASPSLSSSYTFSGGATVPTSGLLGTYKLQ
mgnify:CR=1 FL=1